MLLENGAKNPRHGLSLDFQISNSFPESPHSLYQNPKNLILGACLLGLATSWSVQQPYSLVMGDCPLIVKMVCDLIYAYNTNT